METSLMSESLVVPSDVHQTVTEVLGQLVLDDLKQTDITVKLFSCYVRPDVSLTSADVRPQVT